jgi:hypothetical protein
MAELVRTRQGEFGIEDAVEWEEFVLGGGWEDKVVKILKGEAGDVQKETQTSSTTE